MFGRGAGENKHGPQPPGHRGAKLGDRFFAVVAVEVTDPDKHEVTATAFPLTGDWLTTFLTAQDETLAESRRAQLGAAIEHVLPGMRLAAARAFR
jgi:hypothetical protein